MNSETTQALVPDLLLGTWVDGSEGGSEVEFAISRANDAYVVQARDGYDGEYAEVFDVHYDGCKLSFAAHWKSTGRFARYKIQLLSAYRVDITYTYTDSVVYRRKDLGSEQTRGPQARKPD